MAYGIAGAAMVIPILLVGTWFSAGRARRPGMEEVAEPAPPMGRGRPAPAAGRSREPRAPDTPDGSHEDALPQALQDSILLDVPFDGNTGGAQAERAATAGLVSFEAGESRESKAVRISGVGAHVQYDAAGNISPERGTVFLRLKADDWDDRKHSGIWYAFGARLVLSKYLKRLYLQYMKSETAAGQLRSVIAPLDDARFHDVCVTWQPADVRLYVDGQLADSEGDYFVASVDKRSAYTGLGTRSDNVEAWHGLIARVLVFGKVLTEAEMKSLSAPTGDFLRRSETPGEGPGRAVPQGAGEHF